MTHRFKTLRKSLKGAVVKTRSGLFSQWARISFSQECEDLLLIKKFPRAKKGFYVDIGALHPVRFSNTFMFYNRGWRGIVVEPNPDVAKIFAKARKRDIFVGEGVAASSGELHYHRFTEPALNTFDPDLARLREQEGRLLIDTIKRKTSPLADILDRHMPKNQVIDFMSVDVEGLDDEVLKSNDWSKFQPAWLIVEIDPNREDDGSVAALTGDPTIEYLSSLGYVALMKTGKSVIFKRGN